MAIKRSDLYATTFTQRFSPCGNYLACGTSNGDIVIFSVTGALAMKSKRPMKMFRAHDKCVYCFAGTQEYLVSGGSTQIHAYRWKDLLKEEVGKPAWSIQPPSESPFDVPEINSIVLNEESNTLIAGCGDNNVYVYDMETRDLVLTLSGHTDYVQCVQQLNTTHQVISGGEDGIVRFWDDRTGVQVDTIEPNSLQMAQRASVGNYLLSMDVDQNQQWLVVGGAPHTSVWHLRSKTTTAILPTPQSCTQCTLFHDDYILTAGTEANVFKWSVNGELRSKFPCTPQSVYSLCVNEKLNKLLAISGDSHQVDISTNFEYTSFALDVLTS